MIDLRVLVKAGVHFGHQSSRWSPRMMPYIWGTKNHVHLIDISKTASQLEKAAKFLEGVIGEGKTVLWVGTKKPAQAIIKEAATTLGMPYVTHRWIGGTLTNFMQVKKSITKYLHIKDVLEKSDRAIYTKKELNTFQKLVDRLEKNIGGILNLKHPIGALVVIDVRKERSVIKEAEVMGIPVIGLVDTNSDPSGVSFVIPGNDDATRSIKVIVDYLAAAGQKGKEIAKEKQLEAKKEEELLAVKKKAAPKKAEEKAALESSADESKKTIESKKAVGKDDASKETSKKAVFEKSDSKKEAK